MENPHFSFFLHLFLLQCCTATQPRYDTHFKLSPLLQPRTLLMRVWTLHMCVCAACAYVCERARVCACVCLHLEELPLVRFFRVGTDTKKDVPYNIHIYIYLNGLFISVQ